MGSFLVILAAFGFSTLGIFGKLAYEAGFTRNQELFWRFGMAIPFMWMIVRSFGVKPKSTRSFLISFFLGAIGIGIEATLYFLTLERLGAALTGIFLYLYPAFVALISRFFLKQTLSTVKWLGVFLSLIGCVLTVGLLGATSEAGTINPLQDPVGLLFGIATGAWYAIYLLTVNRVSTGEHPLVVSLGVVSGSAFTFGILTFIEVMQGTALHLSTDFKSVISIGGLVILATVLPFTTLYSGMKRIGAISTSLLSTLELVFTIILAAMFLGEKLTLIQGGGALLILLSVLLTSVLK